MNILTFLLSLALLSVGFAGGMAFAMIFSKTQIRDLQEQNRKLRGDVRFLKKLKKDTVEIIYPKSFDGDVTEYPPENYFNPF